MAASRATKKTHNSLKGQLDLCRGAVFDDNVAQVQQFALGQTVNFNAILPIPHEGPANVSIVKTATNQVLGEPLLVFDSYADENLATLPANNTDFDVTIPTTLAATDCTVAGECVLQWFWFGTAAQQTYESCVDFVIAPAGGAAAVGAGAGVAVARDTAFGGVVGILDDEKTKSAQEDAFGGVVGTEPSSANTVSDQNTDLNAASREGAFGGVVGAVRTTRRRRRSL